MVADAWPESSDQRQRRKVTDVRATSQLSAVSTVQTPLLAAHGRHQSLPRSNDRSRKLASPASAAGPATPPRSAPRRQSEGDRPDPARHRPHRVQCQRAYQPDKRRPHQSRPRGEVAQLAPHRARRRAPNDQRSVDPPPASAQMNAALIIATYSTGAMYLRTVFRSTPSDADTSVSWTLPDHGDHPPPVIR